MLTVVLVLLGFAWLLQDIGVGAVDKYEKGPFMKITPTKYCKYIENKCDIKILWKYNKFLSPRTGWQLISHIQGFKLG